MNFNQTLLNNANEFKKGTVTNFMGGTNFVLTPLTKLKFIMASSIIGEPQYYRQGDEKQEAVYQNKIAKVMPVEYLAQLLFPDARAEKASDVATKAIKESLDYDFEGTLKLAVELRQKYYMRKNPQIISMLASLHEKRAEFNQSNPKVFRDTIKSICQRPDDMLIQFDYYKSLKGSKQKLPGIVKKGWSDVLESMSTYQLKKYLHEAKILDLIRIAHPDPTKNLKLTEIVKTKDLVIGDDEKTWETLKSHGKTWSEILEQINVPHMALLRNLRDIYISIDVDTQTLQQTMTKLISGVEYGKQFPFRYYTAYTQFKIEKEQHDTTNVRSDKYKEKMANFELMKNDPEFVNRKKIILDGLEKCLQESMKNFPKLKGNTMSLCDNSGSSHGAFASAYGSVKVATIANLSAIITAYNTEGKGYVGVFGDRLETYEVSKDKPILEQLDEVEKIGTTVGGGTENGVWIFFREALEGKKIFNVDNLICYSDMQMGHGGLYGINPSEYTKYIWQNGGYYIDVLKLVQDYRKVVNPKVNVFTVQVAGYDNSILPENIYRGAVMAGWTGNETLYAYEMIKLWDEIENPKQLQVIQIKNKQNMQNNNQQQMNK
jgi:hypothetical protein